MEYRQESIATLHDYGSAEPAAPLAETAVVVPLTDREFAGLTPERVLSSLQSLDVGRVVIPLRAPEDRVREILEWLSEFDLEEAVLWCNSPEVRDLVASRGLDGNAGKGRDIWLGMGLAAESEYVALHDADVRSHETRDLRKLVSPLGAGFDFVKAYYARVENNQFFGRLFRLFVTPLVAALRTRQDAPVLRYLDAFRYALAGEMAMTGRLARRLRLPRRWGLEVGTLGEAYRHVGFAGTSQVDLGVYEHDHRSVTGPTGLSDMSHGVGRALFRVLEDAGYQVEFDDLRADYREAADALIEKYQADAWFNDFEYEPAAERDQVEQYLEAIAEPGPDDRLPTWGESPLSVAELEAARQNALDNL